MRIGERPRHDGPIVFADYDPDWPARYEQEAERIRAALGVRALRRRPQAVQPGTDPRG